MGKECYIAVFKTAIYHVLGRTKTAIKQKLIAILQTAIIIAIKNYNITAIINFKNCNKKKIIAVFMALIDRHIFYIAVVTAIKNDENCNNLKGLLQIAVLQFAIKTAITKLQ